MTVKEIAELIEHFAPTGLQENYDNTGLLVGNPENEVSRVLISIDITEEVIIEAISHGCNLIVSHHPLIFSGIKRIIGQNTVQRCIMLALKNDIAIYAAHTNIDNAPNGVSFRMGTMLGLRNMKVLQPITGSLCKLVTFVPKLHVPNVQQALFVAGAGHIGNYDSCSYNTDGYGTFRALDDANPYVGKPNVLHTEPEVRIEVILPVHIKSKVIKALLSVHPYEEVAYDIIPLQNEWNTAGAGIIGETELPVTEKEFLQKVKSVFQCGIIRHTTFTGRKVIKVAICGGSGISLLKNALNENADIFITADVKYHDFFEAENRILIADIGHFESEQFTKQIFYEIITKKMPTFAVRISETNTNPVNYL